MLTHRQDLGATGERLAVDHLKRHGCQIVQRNVRFAGLGEIDIVARQGGCIVFVEVRTRRGGLYGSPEDSLTPAKQARMVNLAHAWLADQGLSPADTNWRMDLIAVEMDGQGRLVRLETVQDVVEDTA
jgi:putative endonuclease